MMGYGYGMWGMWGGFGMLLGLVFWLAVIGLVVWGLRALGAARADGPRGCSCHRPPSICQW